MAPVPMLPKQKVTEISQTTSALLTQRRKTLIGSLKAKCLLLSKKIPPFLNKFKILVTFFGQIPNGNKCSAAMLRLPPKEFTGHKNYFG